ncbi:MAG TPA: glycosyltransferase [Candidatus Saccharimonadales bacterium]|nr:glycosyltransferase [Candidatus Saccharimonadales bacterium]
MKKQPLISVIMPVFNAGVFLREAIESILHQTYPFLELIIIDDTSTDNTKKIIAEYQKKFPHIVKTIFLTKHKGDSGASNCGYCLSKGDFIARMDADDISHPKRLEKQLDYLIKHPHVGVLGTQGYIINKQNRIIGEKKFPLTHSEIYQDFAVLNAMMHPSCLFRKSIFSPQKMYEDEFQMGDDYLTFFKLLRQTTFANLPDVLHYYRLHGENNSLKNPKKQFFLSLDIRKIAWRKHYYQFSLSSLPTILLQILFVSLLPTTAVVPLYLLWRGIYSPGELLQKYAKPTFFHPPIFMKG